MLALVASAVQIRHDSFSAAQLEGQASDGQPIVSFHDALKAARATVIPLVRRIDALPEMTQLVLFVAVTMCSNSSANYTMQQLKSYCNQVVEHEHLDRIDYDSFKQFVERLVDQGLLMSNSDIDNDFGSRGLSLPHDMPVRFGSQLQDIQAAVADKLEAKPVYKKLVDRLAAIEAGYWDLINSDAKWNTVFVQVWCRVLVLMSFSREQLVIMHLLCNMT